MVAAYEATGKSMALSAPPAPPPEPPRRPLPERPQAMKDDPWYCYHGPHKQLDDLFLHAIEALPHHEWHKSCVEITIKVSDDLHSALAICYAWECWDPDDCRNDKRIIKKEGEMTTYRVCYF
jgi:hypothetical protein